MILENSLWHYAEKLIRMMVGIFIFAWMARYLGRTGLGQYSYALAFVALFEPIMNLGLPLILKKQLVYREKDSSFLLKVALKLQFLGALISIFLILFLLKIDLFAVDEMSEHLVFLVMFSLFFKIFDVYDVFFQAKLKARFGVFSRLTGLLLATLWRVFLIVNHYPLEFFIYAYLLEMAVVMGGNFFFYRRYGEIRKIFDAKLSFWGEAKLMLEESWPLIFSGLTVFLYMRIDQLMLSSMSGSSEVGIYSAAIKLAEFWHFIPIAISSSVFPIILKAKQTSEEDYLRKLKKLFSFVTYMALFICVGTTLFAEIGIVTLYKKDFLESVPILKIYIWSSLFVFWGIVLSVWDTAEKKQRYSLVRTSSGAVINIMLNYILIPLFGAKGAAYATLLSYFFSTTFINLFYPPARKIFMMQFSSLWPRDFFWRKEKQE